MTSEEVVVEEVLVQKALVEKKRDRLVRVGCPGKLEVKKDPGSLVVEKESRILL